MTFYVKIQSLDYDDYPVGSPTRIGWFDSVDVATEWIESSGLFSKQYFGKDYYEWKYIGDRGRHSVSIEDVLSTYMTSPEKFVRQH